MKEQLNKTIEILRTRVNSNLERIRANEKIVKRMINENGDGEYNDDIRDLRDINRKLLEENNEAIKIQMNMVSYITRYRKEWENDESMNELIYSEISDDELFEQTVSGKISFNKRHPMFDNSDFVQKLMEYYTIREEYEMCNYIISLRS